MPKLTKLFVDGLAAGQRDRVVLDSELTGFGVRVWPSGRKTFVLWYRNAAGRARKLTLGPHGPLTVEQARRQAAAALSAAIQGQDPAAEKLERRRVVSVAELAERYMREHARTRKKASSAGMDARLLEKILLPRLGQARITAVARADVARLHQELSGTPVLANRVLALASKMFSLAEKWELRPDGSNPCRHVERFREVGRERFLSGEELARLGQALDHAEGREHPSALLALRLLILTGARRNEILSLRWSEVDSERGALRLADSKTGPRIVPLGGPALELLARAPRLAGNPFVCPGEKAGGHFVGLQKVWERLRLEAGLADARIHDLRHGFASVAAAANMGLPLIGKLLGHARAATTARYAHLSLDPLRAASDEVARRIVEAMGRRTA